MNRVALTAFLTLAISVNLITCYNEILRRDSIAYGIATIANKNITDGLSSCSEQLTIMASAADSHVPWALKMLDSSGRPISGWLWGNNYWLGEQSQCTAIQNRREPVISPKLQINRTTEKEYPPYDINFFVAYSRFHNFSLQTHVIVANEDLIMVGLCLPMVCSTKELSERLQHYFDEKILISQNFYELDIKVESVKDLRDDHKWLLSTNFILMVIVLLIAVGLSIGGTMYDLYVYQPQYKVLRKSIESNLNDATNLENGFKGNTLHSNGNMNQALESHISHMVQVRENKVPKRITFGNVMKCFSTYTNFKIILNTKISDESVPSIHGLRFLGMVWVIFAHTLFFIIGFTDNKPHGSIVGDNFIAQVISNSVYCVDTFFFISGFLLTYMFFKTKKVNNTMRGSKVARKGLIFLIINVRRYLRLTPAYIAALLIADVNYKWYSYVSAFGTLEDLDGNCSKYWWRNLLYINNLFPREEMCLMWSWYLSADMQFFVIGTFLMMLSTLYLTASVIFGGVLLVGSCVISGYISYVYEYVPTHDEELMMLNKLYDPPWVRIGPYLIGMAAGFYAVKLNGKLNISKALLTIGWIIGPLLNLGILFTLTDRMLSIEVSAIYIGLSRTLWAIGLTWLIIMCITNHAGIINKILSFKGWIPFSRVTYCAYLINPIIITSLQLSSEHSNHFEIIPHTFKSFGILFATYLSAFLFSLIFETPVVLLIRMVFSGKTQKGVENRNCQKTTTNDATIST